MGFFKLQKLDWDDVEGGLGERVAEEISNFVEEYCCEPKDYWNDETLANDLSVFEEQWQRVYYSNGNTIADARQTVAVLSLINSAFYGSWAADQIKKALVKSATKIDLINILTHVSCAYCEYVSLR